MRAMLIRAALAFLATTAALAQETVLVEFGSSMRYLDNASDPGIGISWTTEAFDDVGWGAGTYGVGYENGSGATALLQTTVPSGAYSVYTRATFDIADVSTVQNLFLGVDYDDGYVAWVNGVEVSRSSSMPFGTPAWNTNSSLHESSNGSVPSYGPLQDISPAALPVLHDGINVLAVGVWNRGAPSSSDLVVVPKLVMNKTAGIGRGPYLQRGTPTEVVVRWRTDLPMDSRVRYGAAPGNLTQVESDFASKTEHEIALTGLSPDTTYFYAVGSSSGDLAGDDASHFFVTSPPAGQAKATRLWVLGDSGTANSNAAAVRDAYYTYTGDTHTDLWLMLGDNAYPDGTDGEYQAAVFDMYPEMLRKSVLWSTLGNHDGHSADSATQSGPYYDIFTLASAAEAGGISSGTEAYYSFDYGNIHFVCLDSYESDRDPGGAMLTWLEQDLLDTTRDWIVAFWHHPPYTKGSHDSDTEGALVDMRENVNPILEAHGVDVVLSGHSHSYERSYLIDGHYGDSSTFGPGYQVDAGSGASGGDGAYTKPLTGPDPHQGSVYAVSGSSGKISGGSLDHPAMYVSMSVLGSMVIDVNGNRLDARFLDDDGAVRDEFTIIKQPSLLPVADFTGTPTQGPAPLQVSFFDESVNGPTSWAWDFDEDGLPESSVAAPSHVFNDPGPHAVTLTVGNVAGSDKLTRTAYVCVTSSQPASPVVGLHFTTDAATLPWQSHPVGSAYDLLRGDLGQLRSSAGNYETSVVACIENDTVESESSDPDLPSVGKGFYYLVRAVDCGGTGGTYDTAGDGLIATRDPGVAAAPASCP